MTEEVVDKRVKEKQVKVLRDLVTVSREQGHYVTGKPGRRNTAMIPESEDLPDARDLHNGYERWPCVRMKTLYTVVVCFLFSTWPAGILPQVFLF